MPAYTRCQCQITEPWAHSFSVSLPFSTNQSLCILHSRPLKLASTSNRMPLPIKLFYQTYCICKGFRKTITIHKGSVSLLQHNTWYWTGPWFLRLRPSSPNQSENADKWRSQEQIWPFKPNHVLSFKRTTTVFPVNCISALIKVTMTARLK